MTESGPTLKRKAPPNGAVADVTDPLFGMQSNDSAASPCSDGAEEFLPRAGAADAVFPKKRRIEGALIHPVGGIDAVLTSDASHMKANASSFTGYSELVSETPSQGPATNTKRDSDSKPELNSREKKVKTQCEGEADALPESPVVEFENIDEAVNARLREKEKRGRNKRKLSADAPPFLEDHAAHIVDEESGARKRTKKIDEEVERRFGQTSRHGKRSRSKGSVNEGSEQRMAKRRRSSR